MATKEFKLIAPPHDKEIEEAILGCCIISDEALSMAIDRGIEDDHFYEINNGHIFSALHECARQGLAKDAAVITGILRRRGVFDQVGGNQRLATLGNSVDSDANMEYYLNRLEDLSMRRKLQVLLSNADTRADDQTVPAIEVVEQTTGEMQRLCEGKDSCDGMESISDIMRDVPQFIEERRSGAKTGIKTGLGSLDYILSGGGFEPGYHIIAAGTSQGKSSLALCIAREAARNEHCVAYFSLEMSKLSLVLRLLSIGSEVEATKIKSGRMDRQEWERVTGEMATLSDSNNLHIDATPAISAVQMLARVQRLNQLKKVDLIVVDYLQLMSSRSSDTREQEVAQISRSLKGVSQRLNVPLLALSQLSRSHEHRTDRKLRLSDLRESGSLEQDADTVIFLSHPNKNEVDVNGEALDGVADLNVAKQREGPTGTAVVQWQEGFTKFRNFAGQEVPWDEYFG